MWAETRQRGLWSGVGRCDNDQNDGGTQVEGGNCQAAQHRCVEAISVASCEITKYESHKGLIVSLLRYVGLLSGMLQRRRVPSAWQWRARSDTGSWAMMRLGPWRDHDVRHEKGMSVAGIECNTGNKVVSYMLAPRAPVHLET